MGEPPTKLQRLEAAKTALENNLKEGGLSFAGLDEEKLLRKCQEQALRILDRTQLSKGELRSRLIKREHSEKNTDKVVARLEEVGLLDDFALARSLYRSEVVAKARGEVLAKQKLKRKLIPSDIIREVAEEFKSEQATRAEISETAEDIRAYKEFILKRLEREERKFGCTLGELEKTLGRDEFSKIRNRVFSAAARRAIPFSVIEQVWRGKLAE